MAHLRGLAEPGKRLRSDAELFAKVAARSIAVIEIDEVETRKDVMTTFSTDLAKFLVEFRTESLPPQVIQKAQDLPLQRVRHGH